MPYILCNDDSYLFQDNNGFSIIHDASKATIWDKIQKANNVCKTMNKCEKFSKYHLQVKYVSRENKMINAPASPVVLDYDILDRVKEISTFSKQLEERRLYLLEQISEADLNIVDIEHAAEFYNLNASQGYKLYKLLHNARVTRRELKNELQKIDLALGTSIRSKNMENLERSIVGLDNKKYEPRINKELFGV